MPLIDFDNIDPASPEAEIIKIVKFSLKYKTPYAFVLLVVGRIFANVVGLNSSQKIAIKLVAKSLTLEATDASIINVIKFILYGTFGQVGVEEADDSPLTNDQRASCLEQIYLTAKSVLDDKITEMQSKISWTYSEPDWRL